MSQKRFIRIGVLASILICGLLISCGPSQTTTPVVIRETVIVEVTKEVVITATPEPSSTPTPGPPAIFEDDFESGEGDWHIESDTWGYVKVQDGEYVLHLNTPESYYFGGNPNLNDLNDYVMDFDTEFISGPLDAAFAIEFSYEDDDNYLGIGFDASGYTNFFSYIQGEHYQLVPWTKNDALNIGNTTNHIRLVVEGIQISFYANNKLLYSMPVEFSTRGWFYFSIYTWDEGDATWSVDNVKVTEL